jgi:quinolinate synthase
MSVSASNVAFEERYTLPVIERIKDSSDEIRRKQDRVRHLAKQRNAVILAHSYQRDEIQEVADLVGDSLKLSQEAAKTKSDVIVFCGVNFMAETAAILCPERTVLLPDMNAGCSLSAAITADELREWKSRYPDAVVVSYVNTSAAVKAESDYCCTSANAVKVVAAIPADRRVLFVPDRFLGAYVARMTKRMNMIIYPGYCHVHKTIRPEQVDELMAEHPDAELLIHPECGCVSSCMVRVADGQLPGNRTFFLSTEGMMRHLEQSKAKEFAVGTEVGILHRLKKLYPDRKFYPINPQAECAFMKTITLDKVIRSLETLQPQVRIPEDIATKARRAIDRMLELA